MSDLLSSMPEWWSVIPPLIAIAAALIFKEVISALLLGVLSGGVLVAYTKEGWSGIWEGLLRPVEILSRVTAPEDGDVGHASVIIFSMLIGGMVGIIHRNGSMHALVDRLARRATNKKRGLLMTWLMGIVIFFDDFANTLIVGTTMRSLTDKLRISREKLAYIVDSTAAPITSVALVTTWIGAELQYIGDGIEGLQGFPAQHGPYLIYLDSLQYMFYPVFTLLFILMLILTGKDFGAMRVAETHQRHPEGTKDEAKRGKIWKGVVPVLVMLGMTLVGLYITGIRNLGEGVHSITGIIGAADSFKALLWGSYSSITVAILISLPELGMKGGMDAALEGFKKMLPAIVIILLAWSLAELTKEMGTGTYISSLLSGAVNVTYLPVVTFVTASLVAFSTGSSWGTMAILYPVVIPTLWGLGVEQLGAEPAYGLLVNAIACVLAGSVLGDHCSPISDTTILSSLASDCDHLAHVRTQLPYALTVGTVSVLAGTLLSSLGVPIWICFLLGLSVLYGIVSYFGQST